jgi:Xaa-Pro aminopeptidase
MFQTFTSSADGSQSVTRIKALRAVMGTLGCDAVLVPRADEHQGEYVPANAERLNWLTGFTGSAGLAVIARKAAALWTDGRYTLQASHQVDDAIFEVVDSTTTEWLVWLARKLPAGGVIGYDPKLHTKSAVDALTRDGKLKGFSLKPLAANPVDKIWGTSRPKPPAGAVDVQPFAVVGVKPEIKIADVQTLLKEAGQDAVVLTLPDSICWLLNIRGHDITHNPTVLAFMIIPASGKPELFVDVVKVAGDAKKHLAGLVKIEPPAKLAARLAALKKAGRKVRLDPANTGDWFYRRLGKCAVDGTEPCIAPKSRKSAIEIEGTRAAHLRDGIAVCRFLAWLDREAPGGHVDEIAAVTALEGFRAATQKLKEISFDTISGSGPNGAIVHYRVTTATNRKLKPGELFLVDSGGQYQDGTTDITRTVAIGKPTREMCERFTLVLKGHIALATARFPAGTRGVQLDTLARHALWQAGLDYDHGTGHGVGSYLSVHEGPQSISKRGIAAPLEAGMIVSNEPGYYKVGAYGIRIENLEVVTEAAPIEGGERPMLGFEALTLAPFDRRLIAGRLLSATERAWLDGYHARVQRSIGPELGPEDRQWLAAACAPL